jgi:hypothetical protein
MASGCCTRSRRVLSRTLRAIRCPALSSTVTVAGAAFRELIRANTRPCAPRSSACTSLPASIPVTAKTFRIAFAARPPR